MTDTRTPTRNRSGFLRIDPRRAADLIYRSRLGQLPGLALFDVRDRGSFERRHVEGAQHLTEAALALAIEGIYDQVGCPEDMLDLWSYRAPWQEALGRVNFDALYGFLGDGGSAMGAVA